MLQSHIPERAGELAARLCRLAGGDLTKVFFCSSGSEGVEAAIKFARAHTGRTGLLYAEGAFHGLTCGALSLMGDDYWKKGFGPLLPGTDQIRFNHLEDLEQKLKTRQYAAFVLEPIQGEAGIRVPDRGYLKQARSLCTRYGTLLVLDEVQTGFCRTGPFLAAEHYAVSPDMAILAKAMSGGLVPSGAVLMTEHIYKSVYGSLRRSLIHTSTYSENGLAMRVGLAVLDTLERENLGKRSTGAGNSLRARLREALEGLEMVEDVRGEGLFSGICFRPPKSPGLRLTFTAFRNIHPAMFGQVLVMRLFRDHGVLTQICGNNFMVLKVAPPLIVNEAQIDHFVTSVAEVVKMAHSQSVFWSEAIGLASRAGHLIGTDVRLSPGSSITVIGGGPAGLSAAIALRQAGFRATVIDHAIPPIDKACGEGLMPDSLAVLERLGVIIPAELGFRFRGIRFAAADSSVSADFPNGEGIGIRRTVLHNLLLTRAHETGVEMLWGAKQVDVSGVHVRVDGRVVPAQFTVAADGQASLTRRVNGLQAIVHERRRYGFRRHYRVAPWSPYMELYWGRKCQVYITPVAHDEICAVSMSRDSSMRLDEALGQFPALRARLDVAPATSREMGALSLSRKLRQVCRKDMALVGDASGSVDAITGEGLCLSFKQALSLTDALKSGNLAGYQANHRAISRKPNWMASLMLTLDKHMGFQRRALTSLANHPSVFAGLLSVHVSGLRFSDVRSLPLGQFCRTFLEG